MNTLGMTASFAWGLVVQTCLAIAGALILALLGQGALALAWAVGVLIALVNSGLLVWRWHQGRRVITSDPGRHMRVFYRSMVERYVGLVVLLGGALWLHLDARFLLAGFITGQIGWLLSALIWRKKA